jgi:hypothetical protein
MFLLSVNLVYTVGGIGIEIVPIGEADVKLYVVAIDGVDASEVGNITRMVDGVLEACRVNRIVELIPNTWFDYAELKINTSVRVINSWTEYKQVVETCSRAVIVNAHGETIPVPTGYSREAWVDKIAEAMAYRNVTWVHTTGYPFYHLHYQEGSVEEWGEQGFQRLMSHIGKNNVTCHPVWPETEPVLLNDAARSTIGFGWPWVDDTSVVERGKPLKGSDFANYTIMPIWGTEDHYMTGAIIKFYKPDQKDNFGFYVHSGARRTFRVFLNNETDGDYYKGYVSAGAALWACAWRFLDEEAISKAEAAIAKAESERRTDGIDEAKTLVQEARSSVPSLEAVLKANKAADLSNKASRPIMTELYALSLVILGSASVAAATGFAMRGKKNLSKKD